MIYDVIIIGSGPAGLAAALYGKRAKLETLVIESMPMSGGQILNTYEVDNYPGLPMINGFDLGMKFRSHVDAMEAEFVTEQFKGMEDVDQQVKTVVTDKNKYQTKSVILAMGATHRTLGATGEAKLTGMGVSYCATCDGAFYKNKVCAVVGGGDVALEDALFLARGCSKVYLIHRRDAFRGAAVLQEKVKNTPNIEVVWDSQVTAINGADKVESIALENAKKGTSDTVSVDGVFIAVGIQPNTGDLNGLVEQDQSGYIKAAENCETSVPGIFAAGDIRTKQLRQVITAAADGANAITSVERYLLQQ